MTPRPVRDHCNVNGSARAVPHRVLYVAGPGDVVGTYRHWREGRDDPSQVAQTYSGQFYDVCEALGINATVIGHHPRRERIDDGRFTIEQRPKRFATRGGLLYHLGQYLFHLGIVLRAFRDRCDIIFLSAESHLFPYWLAVAVNIDVVPVNHCALWPVRRRFGINTIVRLLDKVFLKRGCRRILTVSNSISKQIDELTDGIHPPIREFLPTYRRETFATMPKPNHGERPFRVLFVGRVEENKGVFDLLKIASIVSQRRSDVVFDVAGDGTALSELRDQVAALKLQQVVCIHGACQLPKMQELFSRSHVVIVPTRKSFSEGFNKVVAEGVLSTRPFITSAVCPSLQYVREAGIEVAPENVQEYASAIEAVVDDVDLYQAKCDACLKLREQFFDESRSWAAALRSVLVASARNEVPNGVESIARPRRAARVPHFAGPGDVIGSYRHWREGRPSNARRTSADSHILYLQFAGDFRESLDRFARGEPETYFGQRYSVDEVVRLSKVRGQTTVVCCVSDKSYDCRGPEGIRTIGMGFSKFERAECRRIVDLCAELQPTHAIVRFPNWRILSSLVRCEVNVLPALADSINPNGIRSWFSRLLLARALNSPKVRVVANHQLNSCRNLASFGVDRHKIVAYDWPAIANTDEYRPKKHPKHDYWQLLYCGNVIEEKGVGDILRAVAILRSRNAKTDLQILGSGDIARFERLAAGLGITDVCKFHGRVSHLTALAQMRQSDIVLVPSHHSYAEGLPCTIREALIVHTPLITTDHPMFAGVIVDRVNGLVVPQKSPQSIANAVIAYITESGLYEAVSNSSNSTLAAIQTPLLWGDLIEKWLDGSPDAIGSILAHSLANWTDQSTESPNRIAQVSIGEA